MISAFSMLWTILGLLCFLLPTAVIGMITILWPVKFSRRAQDEEVREVSRGRRQKGNVDCENLYI